MNENIDIQVEEQLVAVTDVEIDELAQDGAGGCISSSGTFGCPSTASTYGCLS